MRWFLLSALLLLISLAWGQEPLALPGKLSSPQIDLAPHTWFYEDISGDTLPLSVVRSKPFRPFSEKRNERTTFPHLSRMVTWLQFAIQNTHATDTLQLYHEVGVHSLITTYENDQPINRVGQVIPRKLSRLSKSWQPYRHETLLRIPPESERTYSVRIIDYQVSLTPIFSVITTPQANTEINYDQATLLNPLLTVMSMLLGCLLFMSLYALYSFLLTKDSAFLYYLLYTFSSALLCFHSIDNRFGLIWLFAWYPTFNPYYPGPLHPGLITLFYGLFILKVIDIQWKDSDKYWAMMLLLSILALQQIQSITESVLGRLLFADNTLYRFGLLPAGLTTLVLLGLVIRSRSPIRGYLATGMVSLLAFTLLPTLHNKLYLPNLTPLADIFLNLIPLWMLVGLSVEAFCFALALAYRGRLIELENRRIQKNYTRNLEAQLAERTQEIQQQSRQLEAQRLKQLEAEFERKLTDTEMVALRAQMNPHFIFNCLNSIKLYTLQHDSEQASEYLTKFARLIRLVLENSRSELVSLKYELEALQLYIELEAMRFKQKVRFMIEVSPEVDAQYVKIPPLLLQPYVENAIWHGLMHKPEGGTVTIQVCHSKEQLLRIEITDDGVGRARAAQLKSKSAGKRKSFGLQVTATRIRMINQRFATHTQTQILDLVDSFGEPCGTKVILEIPVLTQIDPQAT